MAERHRPTDDLIQASRPHRSDAVPGDGGIMLGRLAALRTTSAAALPATELPAAGAADAGATPLPVAGEERPLLS